MYNLKNADLSCRSGLKNKVSVLRYTQTRKRSVLLGSLSVSLWGFFPAESSDYVWVEAGRCGLCFWQREHSAR